MASEWQPIETAPKNGVAVILYYPDLRGAVLVGSYHVDITIRDGVERRRHEGWETGTFMPLAKCEPTHWMPCPAPPAREAA